MGSEYLTPGLALLNVNIGERFQNEAIAFDVGGLRRHWAPVAIHALLEGAHRLADVEDNAVGDKGVQDVLCGGVFQEETLQGS